MTTLEKVQIEKAKSLIRFCHEQHGCRECIFVVLEKDCFEDCRIEYPCCWELPEE